MEFTFDIINDFTLDFGQSNRMDFEISNIPEIEYIEKDPAPCVVSFSADPIYADIVSVIFTKEEEEDDLINGN